MNNLYIIIGVLVIFIFCIILFTLNSQKNKKKKEELKKINDLKDSQNSIKKSRYSPIKQEEKLEKKKNINFKVLKQDTIDEDINNKNIMQGIAENKDIDDMDFLNTSIQNGDKNLGVFINVNRDNSRPYVLIVDDSRTALRTAVDALKNDFEIETATDGLQALEKIKERVPDIIVSDVEMPRLNGFELVDRLKNSLEYSNIPIIIITGHLDYHFDIGIEGGVSSLINKPYKKEDLLYEVKYYIEQ